MLACVYTRTGPKNRWHNARRSAGRARVGSDSTEENRHRHFLVRRRRAFAGPTLVGGGARRVFGKNSAARDRMAYSGVGGHCSSSAAAALSIRYRDCVCVAAAVVPVLRARVCVCLFMPGPLHVVVTTPRRSQFENPKSVAFYRYCYAAHRSPKHFFRPAVSRHATPSARCIGTRVQPHTLTLAQVREGRL